MDRDRWIAARETARGRAATPVIESCELVARTGGGFEIVVRGRELRSGAVPPALRVGGRPARAVRGEGGTVLRGLVDDGRVGDEVLLDLGPGGRAVGRVGGAG